MIYSERAQPKKKIKLRNKFNNLMSNIDEMQNQVSRAKVVTPDLTMTRKQKTANTRNYLGRNTEHTSHSMQVLPNYP